MKRLSIYALILFISPMFSSCGYNKLVSLDEGVDQAWANVEDAYKRRADLVPNLQAIVQGSADFEKETLEGVIEARAKATAVTVDPGTATQAQMQEYLTAQNGLNSALSRLLVTVERYPELRSTDAFQDFMHQYEGTENRISKARTDYNEVVGSYNVFRRRFPQVIFSGMLGFKERPYFEASDEDMETPDVNFDFSDDAQQGGE